MSPDDPITLHPDDSDRADSRDGERDDGRQADDGDSINDRGRSERTATATVRNYDDELHGVRVRLRDASGVVCERRVSLGPAATERIETSVTGETVTVTATLEGATTADRQFHLGRGTVSVLVETGNGVVSLSAE